MPALKPVPECPSPASAAAVTPEGRIVAQARRHFLAHGFRGVTMDDLAAELGMSKRTLYAYFASKKVLLKAVIEDKLRSADEDLGRVAAGSAADFPGALRELLACVRRHGEELQPAFLRDMAREAPELFQSVQSRRRALFQRHFGALLGEGRKGGMIRKDIGVELMMESLLGATDAVMHPRKLAELELSAKDGISGIVSLFLEGVVTAKGRRNR